MKITKFVHLCLLIEKDDKVVLCDPGQFSWESGLFDIQTLNRLDAIVITHEHFDHFHEPFLKAVLEKFPDTPLVTTPALVGQLSQQGFTNLFNESNDFVKVFSNKTHASLDPLGQAPENIAVHVFDCVTVGGDRHDLEETKDILALPATAPWGSFMAAATMLQKLKPKCVIPVHDWHWNETAREQAYDRLEAFAKENGIQFLRPVDGQPIEVDL